MTCKGKVELSCFDMENFKQDKNNGADHLLDVF